MTMPPPPPGPPPHALLQTARPDPRHPRHPPICLPAHGPTPQTPLAPRPPTLRPHLAPPLTHPPPLPSPPLLAGRLQSIKASPASMGPEDRALLERFTDMYDKAEVYYAYDVVHK